MIAESCRRESGLQLDTLAILFFVVFSVGYFFGFASGYQFKGRRVQKLMRGYNKIRKGD